VNELELSQPTISHHLRILREAGLVEASRRGTWAYYRLVPIAIAELARALGGPAAQARAA
jgi:ArsR family transcriptional regulator